MFAKTSKALPRLNKLFAEKKAQKTYWAVVQNQPPNYERYTYTLVEKKPKKQ